MSTAMAKPSAAEWRYPANLVTELRVLAVPAILVAVAYRRFGWALAIFVFAGISDGFDGWLARRFQQQSALGTYLDPLADKSLLAGLFIALALVGVLPWALTILVFSRDVCILVAALVLYLSTRFHDFRPIWWGKASTTAELATVGVALLQCVAPYRGVVDLERFGWFAVTFFALVSGVDYAFTAARRYHLQRA
jgi:cardiolipin synthase (CMP-forming)